MKSEHRWKYAGGALFLFFVTAVLLAMFYALSHTNKRDIFLADTETERFGWTYEILLHGQAQEYEPVFSDESTLVFPEDTEAVRISRTITEEIPFAEIEWCSLFEGVEVFLEEELLHSDFRGNERDSAGFLLSARKELERIHKERDGELVYRNIRLTLPNNYLGKTLYITTYFPEESESSWVAFPFIGNDDSEFSIMYVEETPAIAILTIYALFALLIALLFLMDIPNGSADWRILLLSLYFLLLFLNKAFYSGPAYYGILSEFIVKDFVVQNYIGFLYLMPLFLYLALRFNRRWKILLCSLTAVCFLYEIFQSVSNVRNGNYVLEGRSGLNILLLFAVFAAAYGTTTFQQRKKLSDCRYKKYWIIAAFAITAIYIADMSSGVLKRSPISNTALLVLDYMSDSIRAGDFSSVIFILADISSGVSMVILGMEFIRRTLQRSTEINVLRERSRLTLTSYNQLLKANESVNAVRHEMRHHMTALSGFLENGDIERARRYITSVNSELDHLPSGRYSRNLLVNVIAGTYLDRARAEGIRVESSLNVPLELPIADEDLSVFLNNMLQNALEACGRMDSGQERFISLQMNVHKSFLFIKCVNSTASEENAPEETNTRPGHGYGLAAMKKIAEKYNSILSVKQQPGTFEVSSGFCLPQLYACPD